ncbi:MAG: nucleotide-binding protein [Solirubrobacterales bacterium]
MKPRIFIGSSTEGLDVAEAIQSNLEADAEVTIWTQDVIAPSSYVLESVLDVATTADYGVFVFSPDDSTEHRSERVSAARDNVIFEFGLFVAKLDRMNAFVVKSREVTHIPSDLHGLTLLDYDPTRENLKAALGDACRQIKNALHSGGNNGRCAYLQRFATKEEPSLLAPNCDTSVSYERSYKLLLYMFRHETFTQFRAFDLAFNRWEELLQSEHDQTVNISNEIFESLTRMLDEGRCKDFRRILVVTLDQLRSRSAEKVLRRIDEREVEWRAEHADAKIETRVLIYPPAGNRDTRRRIRELHDFAVFIGERDTLSLIETSLGTPTDLTDDPECRVVSARDTAKHLSEEFDDFWQSCTPIPKVLGEREITGPRHDSDGPAAQALSALRGGLSEPSDGCALIVEAGYIELRSSQDADRLRHLDDAFWLLNAVYSDLSELRGSVFLEAFVNDMSSETNICQFEACGKPNLDSEDEQERMIARFIGELEDRYESHGLSREDFALFGMRRTRNAVTEAIKSSIKSAHEGISEYQQANETVVDIFAKTHTDRINLGYRDAGTSRITARCPALMAQHYFDLLNLALDKQPNLRELWIFDFNRLTEQESVRRGAEAAFVLYSWPENVNINIVNCIYAPNARSGTIRVIKGP